MNKDADSEENWNNICKTQNLEEGTGHERLFQPEVCIKVAKLKKATEILTKL